MTFASRTVSALALAALVLATAGCGSNNTDKIVGKWKLDAPTAAPADLPEEKAKKIEALKLYTYIEFKPGGVLVAGAGSAAEGEVRAAFEEQNPETKFPTARYTLRSGDSVEFTDLPPEMTETETGLFAKKKGRASGAVTIRGDEMTLVIDGKAVKLTRVK